MEPFPSVFLSPLRDFAVSVQAAAKDNKIITHNKSPVTEWFGILNFRSGGASSSLANVSFPWTRNFALLCLSSLKAGHLQELSQRRSLGKEVQTDLCFGFTASDFMVVTYTLYVVV